MGWDRSGWDREGGERFLRPAKEGLLAPLASSSYSGALKTLQTPSFPLSPLFLSCFIAGLYI